MPTECPTCHEVAVIIDQDGDRQIKVCEECGSMVDDFALTNDPSKVGITYEGAGISNLATKVKAGIYERDGKGKVESLDHVRTVARQNKLNQDMETAALSLFEEVYKHSKVKNKLMETKKYAGSVCVYIVLRQNDYPVTIKEFCMRSRLDMYEFGNVYYLIKSCTNIQLPYQGVGILTGDLLRRLGFERNVVDDAKKLLTICQNAWLTTGQHRDKVIYVAGYFAWAASKLENQTVSFTTFCNKFNLNVTRLKKMYTYIRSVLTDLTESLPWAQKKGKKDFLTINLKDVLKFQHTLFNNVLYEDCDGGKASPSNKSKDLEKTCLASKMPPSSGIPNDTKDFNNPSNSPQVDLVTTQRKPVVLSTQGESTICEKQTDISRQSLDEYSMSFLPPSVMRSQIRMSQKRKLSNTDSRKSEELDTWLKEWDGENLTDAQDRDLNQYIRKEKEVKLMEKCLDSSDVDQ